MRRWLLPALLSTSLTLLVLEGSARLFTDHDQGAFNDLRDQLTGMFEPDPATFWRLRPGYYDASPRVLAKWGGAALAINDHGMRGPQVPLKKPADVRRVVVLGGSHPMGMWVKPGHTYSAVLERRLNQHDGPLWSVLNASVAGFTSHQGLVQLESRLVDFQPDLVLCDLGVNDTLPQLAWNVPRPDHRLTEPPPAFQPLRRLLRRSAAWRWALARVTAASQSRPTGQRVPPDRHRHNLDRIAEVAAGVGAKTLYLNQFSATVPPLDPDGDAPTCLFRESDRDAVVDVCGLFESRRALLPTLFVDPIHANADGHALIAGAVEAKLVELGWL